MFGKEEKSIKQKRVGTRRNETPASWTPRGNKKNMQRRHRKQATKDIMGKKKACWKRACAAANACLASIVFYSLF